MSGKVLGALLVLLLGACAQMREITGGDKDEKGPQLIDAVPANGSTLFSSDNILLHFDERIQLERVRERLLISPPLDAMPEVHIARGSDVEIELKAPLRPNTTYTFSLGETVKDLTEGNYAAGMDYVISTGAALDSAAMIGDVRDAFTGEAKKDVLVMLHHDGDTSNFTNSRPVYATRTDKNGHFHLKHLSVGDYRITALRDQNANYEFDLPNEEVAFSSTPISATVVDTTTMPLQLALFQELGAVQRIRELLVEADGDARIVFARPAEHVALRDLERSGSSLKWTEEWSAARDTVVLWPSDTTALGDGRYEISTEAGIIDTVRYRRLKKMPFYTGVHAHMISDKDPRIVITADRPIESVDAERMTLVADSTTIPFTLAQDTTNARRIEMRASLLPGQKAVLTLLPKALHDIYRGYNDTLRAPVGRSEEAKSGTLRVTIESAASPAGKLILHLLNKQGHVVRNLQVILGEPVVMEGLDPGEHTLRLIADANGNGRWDTGQWSAGVQPETVWHYVEPLNVRAAWDLGIVWKLK